MKVAPNAWRQFDAPQLQSLYRRLVGREPPPYPDVPRLQMPQAVERWLLDVEDKLTADANLRWAESLKKESL